MKSLIIFTVISATLASQVGDYSGGTVATTPPSLKRPIIRDANGFDITWAPRGSKKRKIYRSESAILGGATDSGVSDVAVKKVASNLGLLFRYEGITPPRIEVFDDDLGINLDECSIKEK